MPKYPRKVPPWAGVVYVSTLEGEYVKTIGEGELSERPSSLMYRLELSTLAHTCWKDRIAAVAMAGLIMGMMILR